MEKIIQLLEQNKKEEAIKYFKSLKPEEINALFYNNNISECDQDFLLEFGAEKIKSLPFQIFLNVISWISDPELLIKGYGTKLNQFTYDEFCEFIYEGIADSACLLRVSETSIFKYYLEKEQQEKLEPRLERFLLNCELFLAQDEEENILSTGLKIKNLLSKNNYTENVMELCDEFVLLCNEKMKGISSPSPLLDLCMEFIKIHLKNHKEITFTMLEAYIYIHVKELGITSLVKEVSICADEDTKGRLGGYDYQTKTLKIYQNYMLKMLGTQKEEDEEVKKLETNLKNREILDLVSHELKHAIFARNYEKISENPKLFCEEKEMNYWCRNGLAMSYKKEEYKKHHNLFIEENQCDIFGILDSSKQVADYFEDVFTPQERMVYARCDAQKLLDFYTVRTYDTLSIVSPMKKFDKWLSDLVKEDLELSNEQKKLLLKLPEESNEERDILDSFMLGDEVPKEFLEEIYNIANGTRITTNLYQEIASIIEELNQKQAQVKK